MLEKNLQHVAQNTTRKTCRPTTVLGPHATTSTPQKNHIQNPVFPKTPTKNKGSNLTNLFFYKLALLCLTTAAAAQVSSPQIQKPKKPAHEDVEWLWQYSPPPAEGRENDLVLDPSFRPFLAQFLTTPQTFWGNSKTGYKSLADTALDYLSIPGKVLADDNRYITVTGSVYRFNPARGLLWVDLNGSHHLVVFAAIDWIKQSKTPNQPGAEYTLWIFPNNPIDPAHIPAPLVHSIARWTAEPPAGSTLIQQITNAILVDPDGTPHQVPPASTGANTFTKPQTEQKAQP